VKPFRRASECCPRSMSAPPSRPNRVRRRTEPKDSPILGVCNPAGPEGSRRGPGHGISPALHVIRTRTAQQRPHRHASHRRTDHGGAAQRRPAVSEVAWTPTTGLAALKGLKPPETRPAYGDGSHRCPSGRSRPEWPVEADVRRCPASQGALRAVGGWSGEREWSDTSRGFTGLDCPNSAEASV
jgi:hypothetical protein